MGTEPNTDNMRPLQPLDPRGTLAAPSPHVAPLQCHWAERDPMRKLTEPHPCSSHPVCDPMPPQALRTRLMLECRALPGPGAT